MNEVLYALETAAQDYRDRNVLPDGNLEVTLPWWVVIKYGGWGSFCEQVADSKLHPVTVRVTHPSGKVWAFRAMEDQW